MRFWHDRAVKAIGIATLALAAFTIPGSAAFARGGHGGGHSGGRHVSRGASSHRGAHHGIGRGYGGSYFRPGYGGSSFYSYPSYNYGYTTPYPYFYPNQYAMPRGYGAPRSGFGYRANPGGWR